MARAKIPPALQRKWEEKLAAEGLAPLTTYSDGERAQRKLRFRLRNTTVGQRLATESYYAKAGKFLRRIELAHAVWSLHVEGVGRPATAKKLGVPEKVVRLVLEKLYELSGVHPIRYGGRE